MPLPMQGSWTISVKSKEAGSTPQQFIVAGAATGNGTYVGDTTTKPVHVTGAAWSIDFQHKPKASFVDSFFEITFPTNNGVQYAFNIKINDDNVDPVFDDLILTCTTPVTKNDFVVFGNVSWYAGCLFTPCHPFPSVLIDSDKALQAALQQPALNKVIQALYPERAYAKPVPNPPDPGPFRPFLLPIEGNPIVPAQQVAVFPDTEDQAALTAAAATTALTSQIATVSTPTVSASVSLSALNAANLINPNFRCQSGPLAQYILDFWDYTPTASEAAGGPYTGTGARALLGVTTTDLLGNYIFRFSIPCEPFFRGPLHHITIPIPRCIVPLPNIIVQVLDGSDLVYETTPYWNTPHYAEINICVPKGSVTVTPVCTALGGQPQQIIQSIGDITVGPLVSNTRSTSNSFLTAQGTIKNSGSFGPTIPCPAAWAGSLYFYACLNQPAIVRYTIQYGPTLDTAVQFVKEDFSPLRTVPAPVYVAPQSVGPTSVALETDHAGHPGVLNSVPSYLNAQTDTTTPWLVRWTVLKMQLTSSIYQQAVGGPGSIVFRIKGYDASGLQVPGADDNITLYIDNNVPDQFIDPNLVMLTTGGPQSQSNCALFTVPAGDGAAPIQISFRSNQYEGFMASYQLSMDKGSTGDFAIGSLTAPIDVTQCDFRGTIDQPTYGATVPGELTAQATPAVTAQNPTGTWLAPAQTFCAFSINLESSVWVTNGEGIFGPYYSGPILIGIQQGS